MRRGGGTGWEFDGVNMDAKGYATSDGAIIVGGNFRKNARESTYAKSSLGTFPTIKFPKVVPDPILGLDYGAITNPLCPPPPPLNVVQSQLDYCEELQTRIVPGAAGCFTYVFRYI